MHHGAIAQHALPLKVNLGLGNAETGALRCGADPHFGAAEHCPDAGDELT